MSSLKTLLKTVCIFLLVAQAVPSVGRIWIIILKDRRIHHHHHVIYNCVNKAVPYGMVRINKQEK